ncbi:lipase/acyltransferase domain-containing protein [Neobacillus niacini]|uniref:lipase/acyltransferase domain-containing protein n=1 Tax=Neobacillus niacini TaxID=86668 RepID=UPI0028640DED|nr:alpha/beta hydrolase [Neobacillus niacini]MDR7001131.1 pimeloyl-ACP methyl ester carboxylesterase [Neobacillus niacini]
MVPTILIPGIQGTKLVNTNSLNFDTIWSAVQSKYETIYDLALKRDSRFEVNPKSIIERSDVEDLAYRQAVHIIEKKTASPVYIFGYDWRKSSEENSKHLETYVKYLKEKLSVKKFNFIAHSLGGMVFCCYLKNLHRNYESIEHAVLAVCPFKGSVRALISLTAGEGGFEFPLFNANDEFRKIARTFPSVYELCPTYKDAIVFEDGSAFDLFNPDDWQSNIGDDDRPMFFERISQLRKFRGLQDPAMLDLEELPDEVKKRLLILAGVGEETKSKVIVEPQSPDGGVKNFFNFDTPHSTGDGDGAIPIESAEIYKQSVITLTVQKKWNQLAMHPLFLNDGRVQTLITRFFLDNNSLNANGNPWWCVIDGSVNRL